MTLRNIAATLALFMFSCAIAAAQSAPAGNAHPQRQGIQAGLGANPFGEPPLESTMDRAEKQAFSKEVDLTPLRDLAVFNNGRVKILDTLARETVEAITGRRNYVEADATSEKSRKFKYDPLFTYLDILIDPAYYDDKALIHVEYLPLRRAFVDVAFETDAERERWMKIGRLAPGTLGVHFRSIAEKRGADPENSRGLNDIQNGIMTLQFGHSGLDLIAPESEALEWAHITVLPVDSPARQAFFDLGAAWRIGDVAGVNNAAQALAAELPAINSEQYPTTQRTLERIYNSARPFEYGYWLYCLSSIALILAFGTGRRWLTALGVALLLAAMTTHAFGFGARWIIAERLPIQNQFESMTGIALGGAIAGLVIMLWSRKWLFGAAAAILGFLVLITATQTNIPGQSIGREAAILNTSVLLKYHVTTVLVSYGLITLGFITSVFYLATYYAGGSKSQEIEEAAFAAESLGLDEGTNQGRQRVLSDLDKAQMTVLQLAFWTLGVGTLLGAWWADHSWGRWWAFDPKETWALLTWIVYLIVIHVRFGLTKNRALVTAWLSVLGFFVMLWTYFGVNLILPGLHAYA